MSKHLVNHDEDNLEGPPPLHSPRAVDHVSLPVGIPNLTHLTTQELTSLKGVLVLQAREARKKSNQLLNKSEDLRKVWVDTLSASVFAETRRQDFQRLLVKHPQAFLAYAYANSLRVIEEAVRAEMNRRSQNK